MDHTALRSGLVAILLLFAACSAQMSSPEEEVACQSGATRCRDNTYQVCRQGTFFNDVRCDANETCDPTLACVGQGGCAAGTDLIYVVDAQGQLLAFNPRHNKNLFKPIGALRCPAGAPLRKYQAPATPISMSVDRSGRAWVSYTSGEIFHVSTKDASCSKTTFAPSQPGFDLFGMGFASEMQDPTLETLYLSALGDMGQSGPLGRLDAGTLRIQSVGALPAREFSPELTGTSAGDLFGYYPGRTGSMIAKIDKRTAAHLKEWPLPGLSADLASWAFAHWGGQLFVFVTSQNNLAQVTRVLRMNPADGSQSVVLQNVPYVIVGAGVSTCAPLILG